MSKTTQTKIPGTHPDHPWRRGWRMARAAQAEKSAARLAEQLAERGVLA